MFSGTSTLQRWKIEDISTLEGLIPLLNREYLSTLDNVELHHSWLSDGEDKTHFKIRQSASGIRYIPVYSVIERLKDSEIGGYSRDKGIEARMDPAIFIEDSGVIYGLISSISTYFSRIRSNLMTSKDNGKVLWGKVQFHNPELKPPFFYWLMKNREEEIEIFGQEYKLIDVSGFVGSADKKLREYTGKGPGIGIQPPVKTMISLKNDFSGLKLIMKSSNDMIFFGINHDWETRIDFSTSLLINGEKVSPFNPIELVLKIYTEIIPGLISAFNSVKDWDKEEYKYRQLVGKEAIIEIMAETGLSVIDIAKFSKQNRIGRQGLAIRNTIVT